LFAQWQCDEIDDDVNQPGGPMDEKQTTSRLQKQPDGSPAKDLKGNKGLDTTFGFLRKPDNLTFITTVILSVVLAIW
jgi:hypothetical protein